MTTKLLPYKAGSESAKALANKLGIKRLKEDGSTWRGKNGDYLINWGRSNPHSGFMSNAIILNKPENIALAIHKVKSFAAFNAAIADGRNLKVPENTVDRATAHAWLTTGTDVVVRNVVQGHSGAGIEIVTAADLVKIMGGGQEFPRAPLYTAYVRKAQEYRIHVMNDKVFFVQRKARKMDVPDENVNWQVRNLDGGFIYANVDVEVSDVAKQYAIAAVEALGLHFGAVDIIETKRGNFFVLEVNTACGLAGTTLDKYAEAFTENYGI